MILSFFFGFIGGIALGSFVPIGLGVFLAMVVLTVIFYFYKFFVGEEHRWVLSLAVIAMIGIICGVGRVYVSDLYAKSQLDKYAEQKISVEGIIVEEPDVRENNTKLTVKVNKVEEAKPSANADGRPRAIEDQRASPTQTESGFREKILVTVPIYPQYKYGDKVKMTVTLVMPDKIESEDGRSFDYGGYLRVRGIWYTSKYTTISLISSGHGGLIKNYLFKAKNLFTQSIDKVLPQPQSSLLAGLLLGTKQSLGKEILGEFQKTGVSHIVVLSGYNIAIVAGSIMAVFKFFLKTDASASVQTTFLKGMFSPKNISFGFGAVSIILFTMASGGGASAWRAAIMVLIALFAKRMNRDYKVSRVFGFTVVLMLAPNPLLLAFDPSFQLAVMATFGLIFVSPQLAPYFTRVPEKFGLREVVTSTVATQLIVLPFLIYNTGIFSLVSLPINVLILGTIPLTMFLGFTTGVIGLLSLYLSYVPALFTYVLLWYQLTIVHIGASIPFGSIQLPSFSPLILFLTYALIFTGLYFLKNKKPSNIISF